MYSQGIVIDIQLCMIVLYLVYVILLHRRVSYGTSRLYLLLMLPVSVLIPLIKLPLLPAANSAVQPEILSTSDSLLSEPLLVESATSVNYYAILYFAGLGIMLLWMLLGFVKLFILFKRSRIERIEEHKVIFVKQEGYAYTILNSIFINDKLKETSILPQVIAHEAEHIKLGHTYDLIYISLMRVLLWFNPIVWHTQYLLRQIHEYQVDKSVIEKGYSLKKYVNLLIMSEAGMSPEFTSSFGYSFTKKRIAMLIKKNQTNNRWRLLVIMPAMTALLFFFSVTSRASIEFPLKGIQQDTTLNVFSKRSKDKTKFIEEHFPANNPMIVIDGVVSSKAQMDKMDPNDIESVTILKDKTAVKIYGEGAKDGVIVIESKKVKVIGDSTIKASTVDLSHKGQIYIIDGFEVKYDDYIKLSIDKVKKVTVLDRVSGEKIYGTKGAKGVVIVETKQTLESQQVPALVKGIKKATFAADGLVDFRQWVQKRVKYPMESLEARASGRVTVEFYIEKDGTVSNIKAVVGADKYLINEVVRVIGLSPAWSPAMDGAKSVRSKEKVTIIFTL